MMLSPGGVARWVQIALWACLYALLLVGRCTIEHVLLARLQQRPVGRWSCWWRTLSWRRRPRRAALLHAAACVTAALTGAAIPLAPYLRIGTWRAPAYALAPQEGSVLYVLAMQWLTAELLWLADERDGGVRLPDRVSGEASGWLASALVALLATLGLSIASGALGTAQGGTGLTLSALIEAQGAWSGLRWLFLFQPIGLLVWMGCTTQFRPTGRLRASLAWQAYALNGSLLSIALFAGGWQGPGTASRAWLGFVYLVIKLMVATAIQVWMWSSQPPLPPALYARRTWRVRVPLAAANLVLSAIAFTLGKSA